MLEVRFRGGFSDRNGIKPENTQIQLKDFDERTRIGFINLIRAIYNNIKINYWWKSYENDFCMMIYRDVYVQRVDSSWKYNIDSLFSDIEKTILTDNYHFVLTLIEAIADAFDWVLKKEDYEYKENSKNSIFIYFNNLFEKEYVGYRFINGLITSIVDDIEVATITDAFKNKISQVKEHLSKANKYLSDREVPDYENSIKESISAVESICRIITEASGYDATLGKTLDKLKEQGVIIHPALENAFEKLYGFTCDKDGIRHGSGLGGSDTTFAEAKFMLVACCAFINYLMELISKNKEINSDL